MAGTFEKAWCALFLALNAALAWAGVLPAGEPARFVFHDPGHYSNVPVTVHYYKARRADADSPIVFALHGTGRDGKRALADWIGAAERHRLIIVAPEFDRRHFPNRLYQLGGIGQGDPGQRTFPIIENLFTRVRAEQKLNASSYILFGHSAGAQFVHRFMLLMDRPRAAVAIAANAGAYLWPAYSGTPSPWALDENLADPQRLKQAFGRKLIVLLGEQDLRTGGPNFPRGPEAQAQGATRLARGKNFFAQAVAQANTLGAPFDWRLVTVPGVGHDSKRMARAAAGLLF
jgi:predicted esterase